MALENPVTNLEQREAFLHQILERVVSLQERQQEQLERQQEQIDSMERNSQKLQRMWVWLCRKNGWPEDEDPLAI